MASSTREKKLTVGMASYDDFAGVYFTVQALRLYQPQVVPVIDFLVIDNHPGGPAADALREFGESIPDCRCLATEDIRGTAVRDLVFREARTPYVLCVDSHILIEPGAVRRLVEFLDERPDCQDLLQGPLVADDLATISTHFDPAWSGGMYGVWSTDERGVEPDGEPFEIPMQGLGLFACRRDAWLGFNPRFAGFGGEEGYIHEKYRQAGRRTLCLPFLRWIHRFNRPHAEVYPNTWRDRIRNYCIGWNELGLDLGPVRAHFREHIDEKAADEYLGEVRRELANPLFYFDAIYCINLEAAPGRREEMQRRFESLGVARRVRWFPAVETPESHHVGCALSHRAILERARAQQLENVLVVEDDAVFLDDALEHLGNSVSELRSQDWNTFYLGGHTWGEDFPFSPGCAHLKDPGHGLTCTQAIAYNRPAFDEILADVPANMDGVRRWLGSERGIDQYLRRLDKRFLAHPIVASQPSILAQENAAHRDRFTLGDEPGEAEAPPPVAGVFRLNPDFEVIGLDDRAVLLETVRAQTLTLNGAAASIVGLLDGQRSSDEIRELLRSVYPEAAVDVDRDVDRVLTDLYDRGAIQRSENRNRPPADAVYRLDPDFEVTDLEDRLLVFSTRRGQTFSFSPTAGVILGLMDGRRTVAELRGILLEAFPEAAADVVHDVDRVLGTLVRYGAASRSARSAEQDPLDPAS